MDKLDDKQIAGLQRLLSLLDSDTLTKETFAKSFKEVVAFVRKIEKSNVKDLKEMKGFLDKTANDNKTLSDKEFESLKERINKIVDNQLTNIEKSFKGKVNELDIKMLQIRNGRDGINGLDADEKRITKKLLKQIPKDRELEIKDIEGLEEILEELRRVKLSNRVGGLRPADTGVETPSGSVNGTNKAFTVTFLPQWLTLQGQNIYADNGYTLTSASGVLTITLDSAPLTGHVLRSHY